MNKLVDIIMAIWAVTTSIVALLWALVFLAIAVAALALFGFIAWEIFTSI